MNNALTKTLTAGLMHGLKFNNSDFPNSVKNVTTQNIGNLLESKSRLILPYLFPMSSLTKEIEWNGEKFVPLYAILVIGKEMKYLRTDEDARMLSYFLSHPLGWDDLEKIDKAPHWVFELFCMWHLNCFNLSPDEFIEVNETNNPYK